MQATMGTHAIVIGGSMAGLLTARILSDYFSQVTILERDKVNNLPEARKGQPQTRHLHGLLARGFEVMEEYFSGLTDELVAGGAMLGDPGAEARWFVDGGYRVQCESGMRGVLCSRAFLEWKLRQRVLAIPNIVLRDECDVEGPESTSDRQRVTGVRVTHRWDGGRSESLPTQLIVDCAGRGSAAPKWLEQLGYARPQEEVVKIESGYATRVYRRKAGDLPGATLIMITPTPPHSTRSGFVFPMEDDRWIVTLGGWGGDYPSTDEAGFLAFANSLAAPDIAQLLPRLEPLTDIYTHRFPSNLRRRYEEMERFPDGYLVLGDAVCSFNPVYGQGMSSAALQAVELGRLLQTRQQQGAKGLTTLARPYFKQIAKIIDAPWQISAGEDFRFATTEGKKAFGTDFINSYIAKVNRASHVDPLVHRAFLEVVHLKKHPSSLMQPGMLMRVLRNQPKETRQSATPQRVAV